MAYFLSRLEVTLIDNNAAEGRGEWSLDEDFSYYSDVARMKITAPKGFHTDFASVPRLPIVFWLAGDTSTEAAVIHDWLYTSKIVPRRVADAVLREAGKVSGVPAWRRWMIWAGVRAFGQGPWDGKSWLDMRF